MSESLHNYCQSIEQGEAWYLEVEDSELVSLWPNDQSRFSPLLDSHPELHSYAQAVVYSGEKWGYYYGLCLLFLLVTIAGAVASIITLVYYMEKYPLSGLGVVAFFGVSAWLASKVIQGPQIPKELREKLLGWLQKENLPRDVFCALLAEKTYLSKLRKHLGAWQYLQLGRDAAIYYVHNSKMPVFVDKESIEELKPKLHDDKRWRMKVQSMPPFPMSLLLYFCLVLFGVFPISILMALGEGKSISVETFQLLAGGWGLFYLTMGWRMLLVPKGTPRSFMVNGDKIVLRTQKLLGSSRYTYSRSECRKVILQLYQSPRRKIFHIAQVKLWLHNGQEHSVFVCKKWQRQMAEKYGMAVFAELCQRLGVSGEVQASTISRELAEQLQEFHRANMVPDAPGENLDEGERFLVWRDDSGEVNIKPVEILRSLEWTHPEVYQQLCQINTQITNVTGCWLIILSWVVIAAIIYKTDTLVFHGINCGWGLLLVAVGIGWVLHRHFSKKIYQRHREYVLGMIKDSGISLGRAVASMTDDFNMNMLQLYLLKELLKEEQTGKGS